MRHLLAGLLIFILFLSCDKAEEVQADDDQMEEEDPVDFSATDFNVLFIGNSLTYFNDLPALVEEMALDKELIIGTTMIAHANYAIVDHWADGLVQQEIAKEIYDWVIIQQGPSSQEEGRNILIEYGEEYQALCETHGATLAFYMVWPSRTFYHTFDGVIKNYTDAAEMNNATLIPVGKVWKSYFDTTGDFSYYGADGFHPSLQGSKVAAQVIADTLFP